MLGSGRARAATPRSYRRDAVGRYRRDAVTLTSFSALLGFGVLNAGLGPALPYLRLAEHVSYLASVLHQVAFAVGGGLAGVLLARARWVPARSLAIRGGMVGAAVAWLAVGYGDRLVLTVGAAFVVSLLATIALIRVWALLADEHGPLRAVAMAEGEVAVSFGGVVSPLLIGVCAGTGFGWRGGFVLAAGLVVVTVLLGIRVRLPAPVAVPSVLTGPAGTRRGPAPTLVMVVAIVALEFALSFWLASYLGDDVGLSRPAAAGTVSALYVANLLGRLLASRLAHVLRTELLLAAAFLLAVAGLPALLLAHGSVAALIGLAVTGLGIGAMFPLTSALHVGAGRRSADNAVGEVLAAASIGQIAGPVIVAGIAQPLGLRVGLLALVAFTATAAAGLWWHMLSSGHGSGHASDPVTTGADPAD